MQVNLANTNETVELSEQAFGQEFNEALVHQVVTAYLAKGRAGTHAQKTRAEVSGGGKKPWRQKGTGRARAGTIRSPLWKGGGVVFAKKTRDYSQKVNKKMYSGAMRSIMSEMLRLGQLLVIDDFVVEKPSTKSLANKLHDLELLSAMIVVDELSENLYLSARNLADFEVCDYQALNPVSLLKFEKVVITAPAIKKIEEQLV